MSLKYKNSQGEWVQIPIPSDNKKLNKPEIDGTDGQVLGLKNGETKWVDQSGGGKTQIATNEEEITDDTVLLIEEDECFIGGDTLHHYSTEEQVVGTWIDGKAIYEKTVQVIPTGGGEKTYQHNISDFDTLVYAGGRCKRNDGVQLVIPNYHPTTAWTIGIFDITTTDFVVAIGNNTYGRGISDMYITFQYTKTIDGGAE